MTIKLRNIDKSYDSLVVFDDLNVEFDEGEFVSIVGPSGCGKSTLLNIIGGTADVDGGEVVFDGMDANISYVFQSPRLLKWRTVEENLRLVLKNTTVDPDEFGDTIRKFIDIAELDRDILDMYPTQLSGGMQSRVALIRGLIVPSNIVLMDEPLGAVDELTARKIRDEFLTIWQEAEPPKTIVYITHNVQEAVYLSDRVLVMSDKPSSVKETFDIDIDRPRDIDDEEIVTIQSEVYDALEL